MKYVLLLEKLRDIIIDVNRSMIIELSYVLQLLSEAFVTEAHASRVIEFCPENECFERFPNSIGTVDSFMHSPRGTVNTLMAARDDATR